MAWMGRSEDLFPRDCNFKAILYDYVKRHKAPEIQSNLISIMNWASARSAFPLHVCMGMWLSVGRSVCLSYKRIRITLCQSNSFALASECLKLDYGVMETWFKHRKNHWMFSWYEPFRARVGYETFKICVKIDVKLLYVYHTCYFVDCRYRWGWLYAQMPLFD